MMKFNKPLLSGSLILLIAFNIFAVLNFIFQFSMARLLTIVEYGILATLFSIIYILSIFTESIQTVLTKYSAGVSEKGKLKNLFIKSIKKTISLSALFFIAYAVVSIILSRILKIPYLALIAIGIFIFIAFTIAVSRGLMQGKKMFASLGFNMVIESTVKLILAILLVLAGWKIYGAIVGILIGGSVALVLSLFPLRKILREKEEKADTDRIYNYAGPVFFITLIIVVFYSIDIIIARIFLSEELVGYYAIASILAKAIFWGTLPISKAMFPIAAEREKQKVKKSQNIFYMALLILGILIVLALSLFYFFSDFVVRIFAGRYIEESARILIYLALATSMISIANLNLLYKLSIRKLKGYQYLIFFVIIEVALLSYFTSSLLTFSIAFLTSSAIFLWGSILLLNR